MTDKETIKILKDLIERHGAATIASKFGYKSSLTPVMWVKRKNIPTWVHEKFEKVLKELSTKGVAA